MLKKQKLLLSNFFFFFFFIKDFLVSCLLIKITIKMKSTIQMRDVLVSWFSKGTMRHVNVSPKFLISKSLGSGASSVKSAAVVNLVNKFLLILLSLDFERIFRVKKTLPTESLVLYLMIRNLGE